MPVSPPSFALPSKPVAHARQPRLIGRRRVRDRLEGRMVRLGLPRRRVLQRLWREGVAATSTVSPLRQNAPCSIIVEMNMLEAPNAVSCVPLTPSPDSMSERRRQLARGHSEQFDKRPAARVERNVQRPRPTAFWFRVRPAMFPSPDERFKSTSVGV